MKNKLILIGILSIIILTACNDNRLIPTPIEQVRPEFNAIIAPRDSAFAYDRTGVIQLRFSEPMDVTTFPNNFFLYEDAEHSISVNGTFKAQDNDVFFQPDNSLLPGHEYFTFLRARVKDVNGNGIDKDTLTVAETEFITDGDYSANGMPEMVVSNGAEDLLCGVYIENTFFKVDTAADISGFGRQLEMAFTKDGSKLIMSDYNSSNSGIYLFNADTYQLEKKLDTNPDGQSVKKSAEIVISDKNAYVINQSGKKISVVDLNSETITDVIDLPGSPKGMTILPDYSKIYVGSSKNGEVWVVNTVAKKVENTITINDFSSSVRLAASSDGSYVIVREFRGNKLAFIKTDTEIVSGVLELNYKSASGNNNDLAVLGDYVYVSNSSGDLSKVNISTHTVAVEIKDLNFQGLDVFNSGEFVIAVSKSSPSVLIVMDSETLKILRRISLPGKTSWDVAIRPKP